MMERFCLCFIVVIVVTETDWRILALFLCQGSAAGTQAMSLCQSEICRLTT